MGQSSFQKIFEAQFHPQNRIGSNRTKNKNQIDSKIWRWLGKSSFSSFKIFILRFKLWSQYFVFFHLCELVSWAVCWGLTTGRCLVNWSKVLFLPTFILNSLIKIDILKKILSVVKKNELKTKNSHFEAKYKIKVFEKFCDLRDLFI